MQQLAAISFPVAQRHLHMDATRSQVMKQVGRSIDRELRGVSQTRERRVPYGSTPGWPGAKAISATP